MENVAEVWWTGERSACRKSESSQMKMGRKLLGASNTPLINITIFVCSLFFSCITGI